MKANIPNFLPDDEQISTTTTCTILLLLMLYAVEYAKIIEIDWFTKSLITLILYRFNL